MDIGLNDYLLIGAVMFVSGVVCMATKRNGIAVLMGVELVLNGANINFVAFARYTNLGLDGQVVSLFVIVLALTIWQLKLSRRWVHYEAE